MLNVVMTVCGRYTLTEAAINSLLANTTGDYSLVIVEDHHPDVYDFRLSTFLYDLTYKHNHISLLSIRNSAHKLAKLKNLGAAYSSSRFGEGDWLYHSDNDVLFLPNWNDKLIGLAERLEPEQFMIFGGQHHPYHLPVGLKVEQGNGYTEHDCQNGTSMLMRWQVWNSLFGFTEDVAPGVCQSEDFEFTERAKREIGARIAVIDPHVVVDVGLKNTYGQNAPGHSEKKARMLEMIRERES